MRRAWFKLILIALLAAMLPQAALAISAQEALFGSGTDDGSSSEGGSGVQPASSGQYPTLKLGDRDGEDSTAYIVFLQNRLIELRYLRGAADGVYGEDTQTAVLAFQRNNNLPETGIADDETQKKLYSDISGLVVNLSDDSMFGGELNQLQTVLGLWGFYPGVVDGQTGKKTEEAIRTFKSYMTAQNPEFGITPTPVPTATPNPEGKFNDMPTVMDLPLAEPEPTSDPLTDASITPAVMDYINGTKPFTLYQKTVSKGDSGAEALRVQNRLRQLGYLYDPDGVFGDLSDLAVKYFQRKNGLPETGIADQATQTVLFSVLAKEAEEYVFPYKLIVDISDQKVYVTEWTGSAYEGPIHSFTCATGTKENPTPLGTYQAGGKTGNEWYYFKEFGCYAKWAYHIVGGVLFHSNTMNQPKGTPSDGGLGHRASHGCIRMKVKEVKWIYDNCPEGTTVVIQE